MDFRYIVDWLVSNSIDNDRILLTIEIIDMLVLLILVESFRLCCAKLVFKEFLELIFQFTWMALWLQNKRWEALLDLLFMLRILWKITPMDILLQKVCQQALRWLIAALFKWVVGALNK